MVPSRSSSSDLVGCCGEPGFLGVSSKGGPRASHEPCSAPQQRILYLHESPVPLKPRLSGSNPAGGGFTGLRAPIRLRRLSGKVFCRAATTWDVMRSREVRRWVLAGPAGWLCPTHGGAYSGWEHGHWALAEDPARKSFPRGLNPRRYSSEPVLPFFCINYSHKYYILSETRGGSG